MSASYTSKRGRGNNPNYNAKAKSYLENSQYMQKHENYDKLNEWGCHELIALFYEIVLLSKQFLRAKRWDDYGDHQSIIKGLKAKAGKKIGGDYITLYNFSRELRYELLNIDDVLRNDFLKTYTEIKNFFMKKLNIRY